MVVGDIINGLSPINTVMTHQPAVGVEEIIMTAHLHGLSADPFLFDGVLFSAPISDGTNGRRSPYANMKMGITNARYLQIGALLAVSSGFTAIQIQ